MADERAHTGRQYEELKARLERIVYWTDPKDEHEASGMVRMAMLIAGAIRATERT